MKMLILILLLALSIGCAPLTETQKYEREDRETLRIEKYYRFQKACVRSRGIVEIKRHGHVPYSCLTGRENCPPRHGEMYTCVSL